MSIINHSSLLVLVIINLFLISVNPFFSKGPPLLLLLLVTLTDDEPPLPIDPNSKLCEPPPLLSVLNIEDAFSSDCPKLVGRLTDDVDLVLASYLSCFIFWTSLKIFCWYGVSLHSCITSTRSSSGSMSRRKSCTSLSVTACTMSRLYTILLWSLRA